MKACKICKGKFEEKQKTEKYCSTKCAYKAISNKQMKKKGLSVKGLDRYVGSRVSTKRLTEQDLEEIARLIKGGFTSGFLDGEDERGEQYRVVWELSTNKQY